MRGNHATWRQVENTDKQERKAYHIAESYEERGVPEKEAERRAWATVNKDAGGGKERGGSGRGKSTGHPAAHKGGEMGGMASASRTAASRSASAKKAASTHTSAMQTGRPVRDKNQALHFFHDLGMGDERQPIELQRFMRDTKVLNASSVEASHSGRRRRSLDRL